MHLALSNADLAILIYYIRAISICIIYIMIYVSMWHGRYICHYTIIFMNDSSIIAGSMAIVVDVFNIFLSL